MDQLRLHRDLPESEQARKAQDVSGELRAASGSKRTSGGTGHWWTRC